MRTINSIFKTFLVALLLAVQVHFAYAQSAALLPVAPQQFFDKNGNPVSSGSVGYYIPGTSTPKMVWQDDSQTTPWTNPITLNAGGWPPNNKGIYGNGTYRQIIKDKYNNIISDQPTSATGSGGGSGTSVGDGNSVGTILTWSGMIAPNQYQFAYGQSLSRATYPELYQAITLLSNITCIGGNTTLTGISDTSSIPIGAAVEGNCIVVGSTVLSKTINTVTLSIAANISTTTSARFFPYGNGNGTTTFNAPDLRGKVIPGRTNMGGVVSSNLTSAYYGSSPDAVGANGGAQSKTLIASNLPPYTPAGTIAITPNPHNHTYSQAVSVNSWQPAGSGAFSASTTSNTSSTNLTAAFTGTPQGGTSTAFAIIPPSITMNYIIKVTPDTSVSGLFGVASIGGMQGIITCGANITCAGNIISAIAVPLDTSSNYTWTGLNTFDGSVAVTGNLGILYPVTSNVVDARSSVHTIDTSTSANNAQFLNSTEFISTTGSSHIGVDNDGDRVSLYASITGRAGSGNIWGINTVTQADASFPTNGIIQGYELDFNNHNADRGAIPGFGGLASPYAIAQTITGASTFKSTAALMVATAVPHTIWYRGLGCANGIEYECFWDYSNAPTSYSDQGFHTNSLDTSLATLSGSALRIGNGQKISARNAANSADLLLFQVDGTDTLNIGQDGSIPNVVLHRPTVPGVDNVLSLGTAAFRWADVRSSLFNGQAVNFGSGGTVAYTTSPVFATSQDTNSNGSAPAISYRRTDNHGSGQLITVQNYRGTNSTNANVIYGQLTGVAVDATASSEDGEFRIATMAGGALANRFIVGAGIYSGLATGGDQGIGTINVSGGYRVNGAAGLSVTKTVRAAGGASDCTLIFTGGLLTGGTC